MSKDRSPRAVLDDHRNQWRHIATSWLHNSLSAVAIRFPHERGGEQRAHRPGLSRGDLEALTDPEQLTEWLAEDAELDLRPGGDLAVRVDGEERGGFIEEVEAPRRLVFWWGPDGDEPDPGRDRPRARRRRHPGGVVESRPLRVLDARGIEVESWLGGGSSPQMRAPELSAIC